MIRGIGVDLVSVGRIAEAMRSPRFLERILTPEEREMELTPMRVASRWAAKEAIYKALGGGIQWQDVSVLAESGRAASLKWHRSGILKADETLHVTLSHERDHAVAFAVLEGAGGLQTP